MVVFPNIKINLGLNITSKRPDGYHNIESVMLPVPWKEALEIGDRGEAAGKGEVVNSFEVPGIHFYNYGTLIPGEPETNLCIRVYRKLQEWYNLSEIDIHLSKTLPMGAGLGAGSADAAFFLRAMKEFCQLNISDQEAKNLLSEIGSDCPFFWDNEPAFVFGRGNEMRPISIDLSNTWILLIYPEIAISTKEAYANVKPKSPAVDLELLPSLPRESWSEVIVNDFEESVFPTYPVLREFKEMLYITGAFYASMSGSGSTMYGLFDQIPTIPAAWQSYPHFIGKLG